MNIVPALIIVILLPNVFDFETTTQKKMTWNKVVLF